MFKRISPHASFALAAGLALLAVQSALALTSAPVVVSGDGVTGVKVVRNDEPVTTKSTSCSAVQASRTTIQVPDGTNALILARFTGESVCYGGAANNWCTARIMVGGNQAQPSGDDVAFDSTDNGAESRHSWESHSIERVRGPGRCLPPCARMSAKCSGGASFAASGMRLLPLRPQPVA